MAVKLNYKSGVVYGITGAIIGYLITMNIQSAIRIGLLNSAPSVANFELHSIMFPSPLVDTYTTNALIFGAGLGILGLLSK